MAKIIVHIGGAKCGSSAIQGYLAVNAESLKQSGVLIPSNKCEPEGTITGEQIFFFQNLFPRDDCFDIFTKRLKRLHVHCVSNNLDTVIISAENLINLKKFADLFRPALSLFDKIEVVAYLRRQDDYFISSWQQWKLKVLSSIQEYVEKFSLKDANWLDMLNPWEDLVGRENMKVRLFQRDKLVNSDVVNDFIELINLDASNCKPVEGLANRSFDEHIGDIANRVRDLFAGPHDNEFYEVMVNLIGEKIYKSRKATHLLTYQERLDLLKTYNDVNEELRNRYFLDSIPEPPLFTPPSPEDSVDLTEDEKRRGEIDLLARAIYNLGKRLKNTA